nr:unnamed protein product [Callosobruchus chinensis]
MEESSEIIIARLVLGYLRNENCRGAYKEFLKTSAHLQENNIAKSKFLRTRFMGLSLEDIFREYVDIHQMVQARLEATDYFHEEHSKRNLLSQILYLFNKIATIDISRTSTPCHRSPREFNRDEASPCSYIDQASDVETTPMHALPGNTGSGKNERYPKRTTKKAVRSCRTQQEDGQTEDSEVTPNSAELLDTEVLANTLLENKEFHEKIAQTINKVVEKQHRVSGQLDKTVKTVVKETEEDPMFDQLLDEIIGSAALIDNPRPDSNKTSNSKEDNSNKITRNNKKQDGSSEAPVSKEDEINKQNSEAINCLVANSSTKSNAPVPSKGEVIVFDGSLDNFMNSNICTAPVASSTPLLPIQNQIYVNTTGLLIATGANTATMASLTNTPMQAPLLLTEQDILSMPTVIVSDNPIQNAFNKTREYKKIYPRLYPQIHPPAFPPNTAMSTDKPPKRGLKKVVYPVVSSSSSMVTSTPAATSKPEASLPQLMKTSEELNLPEENVEVPPQPATPPALENLQKVTPKSASHVRNLDFSTPPKINKKDLENALTKQVTKTLFPKKSKEVLVDVGKTWDSDLRVGTTSEEPVSKTPKRRKKMPLSSKKAKKAKITSDTTLSDAAALEAALQTPIKSSEEKSAHNEQDSEFPVKQSAVVEPVPESQVSEAPPVVEIQGKTILSPSKMNATKRSLVSESASKFITPENGQEGTAVHPIKANRNIIPMLETPLKDYLPKTPGVHTPQDLNFSSLSNNITPFSKMLEANLTGLDINQIPTPNIPITPNFPPFTPNIDFVSPFSNRPTDYSASSSYYQPSDNEQDKALGTQLREIEKKSTDKTKNERLKNFNKNVIGKKNLNLMKRNVLTSSSSEDDSSDSFCKENNDTVICSKSESPVQRGYSLRTRNIDRTNNADCSKREVKKTPRKVVRRKAQNKGKGNEDAKRVDEKKAEDNTPEPAVAPEVKEADDKQTDTAAVSSVMESTSCIVELKRIEVEIQSSPIKSKKSKTPKKGCTNVDAQSVEFEEGA